MCCTADFFTYFHKMIGTSECTCMCLCVCQYVCNTIHARSATKVSHALRHCFDVEQPGFQATTSRYIYTYLTNGVLLVFYDFDTPLQSIWNNCSAQREIPVCSLLPSYVTLLSPFCVYMYNVSQALQHLIEMLSCHPVTNTKLLEVASLNMNTVDGVYAFTQMSPVTIMPTCISVF